MPNILYLHGFASGPGSQKGRFFYRNFALIGAGFHQPDLNEGDFEGLTITRQLRRVEELVPELKPRLIIGSSLGGYLAALYAARHPGEVRGLALLAPAFGFARRWRERLGEAELARWREQGFTEVYHYGYHEVRRLGYGFYEDALRYEEAPPVAAPALIFHGKRDEVVDPSVSVDYAWGKANVELELLNSDHSLMDVLDPVWDRVVSFYQNLESHSGAYA